MLEKTVFVKSSLEVSSATLFVQAANRFSSNIYVKIDHKKVNAKSIMGMISLGILDGQEVTLNVEGADEKEAIDELVKFFNN